MLSGRRPIPSSREEGIGKVGGQAALHGTPNSKDESLAVHSFTHLFDIHLVMSRLIISVLMRPEEYIPYLNIDVQSAFSSSMEI